MTANHKAALRRQIRGMNPGEHARNEESAAICRHILDSESYQISETIAGYMPLPWEADITSVLEAALKNGKRLVLPRCEDAPHMKFFVVNSFEKDLQKGAYGLLEPVNGLQAMCEEEIDLMLVPLEGIDPRGYRLGKGGGYYDCILKGQSFMSLGCALSWQHVAQVPAEAWDQPLSACADRDGIYYYEGLCAERKNPWK